MACYINCIGKYTSWGNIIYEVSKVTFISDTCIDDGNDDINLEWTLSSLQIHWALGRTTSQ